LAIATCHLPIAVPFTRSLITSEQLNCTQIGNQQLTIGNVWMADRPRLLPSVKRSNSDKFGATPSGLSERCDQRVLLATFSIRPHHATSEALSPPFFHFDPFGTEFREPGRVSHPLLFPIVDWQLVITKILPVCAGVPGVHAPVET
jgi:hypothetical protein